MSISSSMLNSPSENNNIEPMQQHQISTTSSTSTTAGSSSSSSASSTNAAVIVAPIKKQLINKTSPNKSNNSDLITTLTKHWSQKKHESVLKSQLISKILNEFLSCIKGGSDNGQFVYFTDDLNNLDLTEMVLNGKVYSNEIILEIQNQKISGFTLHDVLKYFTQLIKSYPTVTLRTVKWCCSNSFPKAISQISNLLQLPLELREYLDERFQKGSIDYDLQQTIRENVYMRTVPCTTRAPRNGEIDGQDYIFLTNDQFLELEQNGSLLEYGVYNGHYYGTPKPPKQPKQINQFQQLIQYQQQKNSNCNNDQMPLSRNNSVHDFSNLAEIKNNSIDIDSQNNSNEVIERPNFALKQQNQINNNKTVTSQNIELDIINNTNISVNHKTTDKCNENEFIPNDILCNKVSKTSQSPMQNSNILNNSLEKSCKKAIEKKKPEIEMIPYGWEKVDDPEYGTFYIDHINKQTTYENPFKINTITTDENVNLMKTFKPAISNELFQQQLIYSPKILGDQLSSIKNESTPLNGNNHQNENSSIQNINVRRNIYFTQNPEELKGDFLKTSLLKTPHGFGFTIIGANETSEDFLQIKYIVPDGAAFKDGKLNQGDILVYVNNECVLGYTHQDVVEIFQSIPIGNYVNLTVCRGYPLSIDPNDPNIEIMSLAAINNPNSKFIQAPLASVDELTSSTLINSESLTNLSGRKNSDQLNQLQLQKQLHQLNEYDEYYCEEYEEMYAPIIKGPKGFGFTIADDSQMNHQKVKQILDKERCCNLNENDILLEINGIDLRFLNHNQVVDVLKDCAIDKETIIKLKRRKYQIHLPAPPNNLELTAKNLPPTQQNFFNNSDKIENLKLNLSSQEQSNEKKIGDLNEANLNYSTNLNNKHENVSFEASMDGKDKFQSMSCLKQTIFDLKNKDVHQKNLLQDLPSNYNQKAFNYERRSKTPNILQLNSNNTSFLNDNNSTLYQNGNFQLRSKTPTTDRVLFQHSQNNISNVNSNEYVYLNDNKNNNNNSTEILKSNSLQQKNINELYSSINISNIKNLKQHIFQKDEYTLKKNPTENDGNLIPIYDFKTNVQQQRVLKNLTKFNNLNSNSSQNINQLTDNRSKTPGPDIIYFHNCSSHKNASNNPKSATISASTGLNHFNYLNRSKTPTADIMYYPSQSNNKKFNPNYLFDNIYQPFNSKQTICQNNSIDNNNDQYLINLLQNESSRFSQQQACFNQILINSDVDGNHYLEITTELHRQESGFGFRIVGGEEEGSQVAIGYIVQGGSAHLDNILRPNDEIIMIDNECVLGATHRRVVQLMTIAGLNRKVKLMVRRKIDDQQYQMFQNFNNNQKSLFNEEQKHKNQFLFGLNHSNSISPNSCSYNNVYPYTITLFRNGNEGFGFVIISTLNKNGPSIGKIVETSPADRCKRLNVGDRILAVNGINITQMNHIEIVKLIKESGNSITLTIGAPIIEDIQSNLNICLKKPNSHLINEVKNGVNHSPNGISTLKLQNSSPVQSQKSPKQHNKAIINQNEYHVIELRKHQGNGFGFSIRGGKEFNIPLFVLKLADQGPAASDGRLHVGDQILEINGFDAYNITHSEAIERIKSNGNIVTLLIRRTGLPPPSITDIIAANSNGAAIVNSNSQMVPSLSNNNISGELNNIQQNSFRSKSPYFNQQQVKHFNSSGTLLNRNY